MTPDTFMSDEELVQRASEILFETLGAVEASRFLSMSHQKRTESVKRHRAWQGKLDKDAFFSQVFKE